MAEASNNDVKIERLSADDIAEAERRRQPTSTGRDKPASGRKRIDRNEMTAPVARAAVRIEKQKLPSGRVLRTYQAPEVK